MAFLRAVTSEPTGNPIIDVLVDGYAWDLSFSRTISWALADGLNPEHVWDDRAGAIQTFSAALASIEQFINVEFDYVGDFTSPIVAGEAGADLVYTLDNSDVDDGTLAYAYYPGAEPFTQFEQYSTEGGDVFMNFNNDIIAGSSFRPGSEGFLTVIHEIGHALGLKHPFDGSPGRPTLDELDQTLVRDLDWFSIMSYSDQFEEEYERWDPATPMILDVLGLQYLYGVNTATNAGDTTLALTTEDYYYTLWDASGNDRADASGQSQGWTIFLPDFAATPLVDTLTGFALPSDQFNDTLVESAPTEMIWLMGDIENATGSAFNDWINGSALDNDLRGGAGDDELEGYGGNDTIDGNDGIDLAYFLGDQSSYTLTIGSDGITVQDRRADGAGTDTLRNVELVEFYTDTDRATLDLQRFGGPAGLSAEDLQSFIELYIAYFNRAPDALGLNFWGTAFANGTSLQEMAALFVNQDETRAAYPEGLSNEDFATAVYDNVLGRTPDPEGYEFWVNALNSGGIGRDVFILGVLEGAKADPGPDATPDFIAQQLADREFLADKTDIGALYAVHRGMSDVPNAIAVMAGFDGSDSSLAEAVASVDQFYAAALDPDDGAFLMPLVGVLDNPFDAIA
ncbi:MAG: DUF4214 domain-containing protein [Marivita sp.]|uniref:DUF4214 domain-containing protein n=1 Tax=Marivita sp. TaxID=2003365 RepID=UPI0025BA0E4A|nr:DUF4214 domain-containing protein [Marivita sp.]MCI5111183.1 DUF4214 domain-containing protein [Marivita sp.]